MTPGVVLVDDEPRLRGQLGAVLGDYGIRVLGEAGNGREGVELAQQLRPDVVLIDLRMPELDGIAATRLLSQLLPSTAVVVLSAYDDPALMREAREAGACAYLVKGCRASELVEVIEKAVSDHRDAYLAAGAVLAVAYYLVPATDLAPRWAAKIGLYNGLGLSAVAAIGLGVVWHRPERPLAWWLFAVGLLSYVTADIIFYTYQDILGQERFPSLADVFYLAAYPFLMAGLLLLIRARSPGADRARLLDALVITVGVGMLSWVFLVGPLAQAPGLTLPERLVSMAYPIMDVLLLSTAVRLVVDGGARPPAFWVLLSGVGALLVTDTLYSVIQLSGGYHTGSPIDTGWMAWYACWGAAALHPTMRTLAEPAPQRDARLTRWRLGLLAAASLLAPAVQVVQLLWGHHTEQLVTAVGSMVLFGLVLARLHGLAGEVAALAGTRKRLLDWTMQAREEERIRLAADLHDGPIQRLSGVAYTADLSRRRLHRGDLAGGQELLDSLEDDICGEVAALRRVMVELRPRPWTNGGCRRP